MPLTSVDTSVEAFACLKKGPHGDSSIDKIDDFAMT